MKGDPAASPTDRPRVLALDIGGVHVKAAHSNGQSWRLPTVHSATGDELCRTLTDLIKNLEGFDRVRITMTAELCDTFATKREGVHAVLGAAERVVNHHPIQVWSTRGRFASPHEARAEPSRCAAANWHALATYAASWFPRETALLIDTGSTTTDIVMLRNGRPITRGLTDTERLASGELIYIGASRTPLEALGPRIDWRGHRYPLMAEWFASTADAFLLTGHLPESPDSRDTADGRPMLRPNAAARLVRMIGADLEQCTIQDAQSLAQAFFQIAERRIADAILQALDGQSPTTVLVSGSGEFLAAAAATLAIPGAKHVRFSDRIGAPQSIAACAYALLSL
jgi:probable H4MPT-linked C1 transfer pathway protein